MIKLSLLIAILASGCIVGCSCGLTKQTEFLDVQFMGDDVHYGTLARYSEFTNGMFITGGGKQVKEEWQVAIGNVSTGSHDIVYTSNEQMGNLYANLRDTALCVEGGNGWGKVFNTSGKIIHEYQNPTGKECRGWFEPYKVMGVVKGDRLLKWNIVSNVVDTIAYCNGGAEVQPWGALFTGGGGFIYRNDTIIKDTFNISQCGRWINSEEEIGVNTLKIYRKNLKSKIVDYLFDVVGGYNSVNSTGTAIIGTNGTGGYSVKTK